MTGTKNETYEMKINRITTEVIVIVTYTQEIDAEKWII